MNTGRENVTIINFHGIGEPDRAMEPGEDAFWLSKAQFCGTLDRIADRPDRSRFVITFDDSNMSDLTIAVPELQSRGMKAEFFILTGRFGSRGSLDKRDVQEIVAAGMSIGSHGIDHRDLASLDAQTLDRELVLSKTALETVCGERINTFSIPFGRYNARVIARLRKAGYSNAFTSDGGKAHMRHFLRPRRSLRNDMSWAAIEGVLSDTAPVLSRLRRVIATTVKQLV